MAERDNGNKVAEELPGVDQWTAGYDLSDRKVMSANAAGVATTRQYDPAGNVVAITNHPDGFTLRFEYDAGNRVVRARDEEGLSVSRTLDVDGKPRTVTDPNGLTTSFAYWGPERHGRLKSKTAPSAAPGQAGLEPQYDYDPGGNVIRATVVAADGSGTQETLTSYDERNRPTRIVGPLYTNVATGQAERLVTCLTYNLLGFRMEVRAGGTADATGTTPACGALPLQTQSVYDDFGRKLREIDALGRAWMTSYDVHGHPLATTDPKGQTTSFTWGQGRQLLTRAAGGQTTRWTRNDLGQVTQVFLPDPTALYSYTYDAAHRVASVTDHRGPKTLTYNWSPGGLLNFFEDSDGNRTDYSYDPHGRLTQIWAPNGDVVDFLYDAGGRLTEKWFPNGVQAQYAWNGDGTLAGLTNRHGATTITSHVYGYDGFRNRRTHTETIGGTTTPYRYGYDNVNRLIEVRHDQTSALLESYAYDALGNRTRKTDAAGTVTAYVQDAANQLLEARQGSPTGALLMAFVYDVNGNLTRKCDGGGVTAGPSTCTGATVMDLTYDALNRLAQVAKTGLATQTYTYDDSGRRIQKVAGSTVTNYVYTGEDIHATFGPTWANTATYTHGPNTDDAIIKLSAGAAQYFHADGLGSIVALTNAAGAIDSAIRYDAWGNHLALAGSSPIYGFTGREDDGVLIYYRSRHYDPSIGRFTQRDTIGFAGGLNLYGYVESNPLSHRDPWGERPLTSGEIGFLTPVFQSSVNYAAVDIKNGAGWNPIAAIAHAFGHPAITLGNTVYMKSEYYRDDFSKAGPIAQGLAVHETVHVWQGQVNPDYSAVAAGIEGLSGAAAYQYDMNKDFNQLGYEQQAQLVQDYFVAKATGETRCWSTNTSSNSRKETSAPKRHARPPRRYRRYRQSSATEPVMWQQAARQGGLMRRKGRDAIMMLLVVTTLLTGCQKAFRIVIADSGDRVPIFRLESASSIAPGSVRIAKFAVIQYADGHVEDVMWRIESRTGEAVAIDLLKYGVVPEAFHEVVKAKPLIPNKKYEVSGAAPGRIGFTDFVPR